MGVHVLPNELILEAFLSVSKSGVGPLAWLNTHQELWPMVLPAAATKKIMACSEAEGWKTVSAELDSVLESSLLGKKLFGWAAKSIVHERVIEIIEKQVSSFLGASSLDDGALAKAKDETLCLLRAVSGQSLLDSKRKVTVKYRGWDITAQAASVAEEMEFMFSAAVRGYAAAAGDLPLLPGESWLCKVPEKATKGHVQDSLLRQARDARTLANSLLAANNCESGESLKELGCLGLGCLSNLGCFLRFLF